MPGGGEHSSEEDGHQRLLHQLGSDVPARPVMRDQAVYGCGVLTADAVLPPLGGLPEGQVPNPYVTREEEVGLATLESVNQTEFEYSTETRKNSES